jgi:hypothetical protein
MMIKAVLAICVGYGAGVWFSTLALKKQSALNRARGWFNVRGRILESTLYKDPQKNATHFRIRYEFHVGERIEGCTPRIAGDWFWNDKQQTAFVARYTPGAEVEVYYDPRDPRQNCLDRTDSSGISAMWVIALGGTLLASLLVWLQDL